MRVGSGMEIGGADSVCEIRSSDFVRSIAITVTKAARSFAGCINRVHYQDVSFVLLKNGTPVAQLVPNKEKVCSGRDLARF
jgi:hypothetical protein